MIPLSPITMFVLDVSTQTFFQHRLGFDMELVIRSSPNVSCKELLQKIQMLLAEHEGC